MPWTAPVDRATGYVPTATDWNALEDNETFLYGDAGWTAVTVFLGTWAAGSPAPAYMLIGRVVYLRGVLTSGVAATNAFTLPAGYRPSATSSFACTDGGGTPNFGGISISTGGVVTVGQAANTWLSGVSFPVA